MIVPGDFQGVSFSINGCLPSTSCYIKKLLEQQFDPSIRIAECSAVLPERALIQLREKVFGMQPHTWWASPPVFVDIPEDEAIPKQSEHQFPHEKVQTFFNLTSGSR
jgi:hypothetical protein